jgi:hypothetical protein
LSVTVTTFAFAVEAPTEATAAATTAAVKARLAVDLLAIPAPLLVCDLSS